jgi:hypothetical protein
MTNWLGIKMVVAYGVPLHIVAQYLDLLLETNNLEVRLLAWSVKPTVQDWVDGFGATGELIMFASVDLDKT